ncbi:UBX domain-containing protein 2-like [Trifolium medium]|uniref:UBX domain-containing protein 2-like n=1 Tax=Trifolium medium TaxID=97028 RepID=A0A392Q4R2_9FABA|nr:UBX domain-containing protein 2-like [Trifolium medium]
MGDSAYIVKHVSDMQFVTKLNRDTWANDAVSQTISTNFIFWQLAPALGGNPWVVNILSISNA